MRSSCVKSTNSAKSVPFHEITTFYKNGTISEGFDRSRNHDFFKKINGFHKGPPFAKNMNFNENGMISQGSPLCKIMDFHQNVMISLWSPLCKIKGFHRNV